MCQANGDDVLLTNCITIEADQRSKYTLLTSTIHRAEVTTFRRKVINIHKNPAFNSFFRTHAFNLLPRRGTHVSKLVLMAANESLTMLSVELHQPKEGFAFPKRSFGIQDRCCASSLRRRRICCVLPQVSKIFSRFFLRIFHC